MKIIFLLPPSEQKQKGGKYVNEKLSFNLKKPLDISLNATQKDLKCSGARYQEGIDLNKNIHYGPFDKAINRYSGVMYNSIGFCDFDDKQKDFFNNHFLILSGMYGILKPLDKIGNYKLPIETKGLLNYWKEDITKSLNNYNADFIIDLLPMSYKKVIDKTKINSCFIEVNFIKKEDGKKISHGVKKIKGKFIQNIVKNKIIDYNEFGGEIINLGNNIIKVDINI